ncbi:crossover junction endodeoxyribonuclease RuvC [Methanocella sp. MCL-LM]|uniref:crossover junction endodeoxyribonuclease RuvC n=1 Tax=Methanocella sp. MCL-LM TaxID=3412035 RepID=UPI003C740F1F
MPKRILAIDPGLATMGYAIVEEWTVLDVGVIKTTPDKPLAERLQTIYFSLQRIIVHGEPDEMAIEELFSSRNVSTVVQVAQARGVALLVAAYNGLPVYEYTPNKVKLAITGRGNANKTEVGLAVRHRFGLMSVPKPDDAADACAIAWCHLQSQLVRIVQ